LVVVQLTYIPADLENHNSHWQDRSH
jgi:hypothetical protein